MTRVHSAQTCAPSTRTNPASFAANSFDSLNESITMGDAAMPQSPAMNDANARPDVSAEGVRSREPFDYECVPRPDVDRAMWLLHPVSAAGRLTIARTQYEELRSEAVALTTEVEALKRELEILRVTGGSR